MIRKPEQVEARAKAIHVLSEIGEYEQASTEIACLHRQVLEAIAFGCLDPVGMAKAAIMTGFISLKDEDDD